MAQLPLERPERSGRVLALDLGTRTGWAVGDTSVEGVLVDSGAIDFPKEGHPGRRWLRLWSHLDVCAEDAPINRLVFENFVGGLRTKKGKPITTRAPIVWGGLSAIVEAWACNANVPISMVNASSLKKSATASGRASKEAMVAAANRLWPNAPVVVRDHNHADALCMLAGWLDGTL